MPLTASDLRHLDLDAPLPLLIWAAWLFTKNDFASAGELRGAVVGDLVGLEDAPREAYADQVVRLVACANSSRERGGALFALPLRSRQCSSRPVAGAAGRRDGAGGRASAARSRLPCAPSRAAHSGAGCLVVNEPARLVAAAAARAAGAGAGPECGPRAAAGALRAVLPSVGDREDWVRAAWTAALLGSCPASIASVQSGLRCWFAYAGAILGLRPGQAFHRQPEVRVKSWWIFRCDQPLLWRISW